MSRLIIKNLPTYVTPQHLRAHFSKAGGPGGTITDVQVPLKPDGSSRRFGFVGYKAESEAKSARDWFDRTYVGSTRIDVAVIEGAKDAPAPRPNKRPRLGPSPSDKPESALSSGGLKGEKNTSTDSHNPKEKDPQLAQFMQVMQPRTKKGPSWANRDDDELVRRQSPPKRTESLASPERGDEDNDEEEADNQKDEGISDLDWMKRRMKPILGEPGEEDKVFEQFDDDAATEADRDATRNFSARIPVPGAAQTASETSPSEATAQTILSTGRLFLRNLAFSCADEDLLELFKPFGEISQVHIPLDTSSKQAKGMAYVTFAQPPCALAAYDALDKRTFQGRLLHILPAVDRKGKFQVEEGEGATNKKRTLKDERNTKRKATAGREFNWAMLYMNSDAVASSIADRMNIPKADILNPESDNAAVKLALAETYIINETKAYLESQGIVLSSFTTLTTSSTRHHRSDTTILVKNIPYGTTATQIRELFEPHGNLGRVVVPPAGTMAVVEFLRADEAARAFRAVAYRRMGSSVVYLERAPLGVFKEITEDDELQNVSAPQQSSSSVAPVRITEAVGGAEGATEDLAEGTTLFVKNLSFSTTTDRLTGVLRTIPGFSFARVQTKPADPKRAGPDAPRISMGYGFVGFKTVDAAKKGLKGLHGYVLDGHALHVKFAGRGREEEKKEKEKEGMTKTRTTKMIVKNVPFEASKKDIRDLFGAHGQLKSVRLPKKHDARSRGFAFLEFVTRREAENAYEALRHAHLLGRHLVLDWAQEAEQDLDVLRAKAGVGFGKGSEMPGRKRKLEMGGGEVEEDL